MHVQYNVKKNEMNKKKHLNALWLHNNRCFGFQHNSHVVLIVYQTQYNGNHFFFSRETNTEDAQNAE